MLTGQRSPLAFFVLVFALSIPFWAAGALTARQLLPALPIRALGFLCPLAAALLALALFIAFFIGAWLKS